MITTPNTDALLRELHRERIFSITKTEDGMFEITEECDRYFTHEVTAEQLRQLGEEIIALSGVTRTPSPSVASEMIDLCKLITQPHNGDPEAPSWSDIQDKAQAILTQFNVTKKEG